MCIRDRCEIITSCGKALTIDAKVAPAPRATNNAGKAQHINVDVEAKSVNKPSFDDSCLLVM